MPKGVGGSLLSWSPQLRQLFAEESLASWVLLCVGYGWFGWENEIQQRRACLWVRIAQIVGPRLLCFYLLSVGLPASFAIGPLELVT